MEFGIFLQGHVPRHRWDTDPDAEHTTLMTGLELARVADATGWKYIWGSEHHFLAEYSHMSCPEVYLGYMAAITSRAHIGPAIFTVLPQVNHPVRVAERVAMFDHLTEGRFEFGTGRGAGSREVTGFGVPDIEITKEIYDEVIREFARMWRDGEYSFDGEWFSTPPRTVLPKPWGHSHPPMWCAASNPASFARIGAMGMGAISFSMGAHEQVRELVDTYKGAVADAEPVGDYVNDNVMTTNFLVCLEDGDKARRAATTMGQGYRRSLMTMYHDTFPRAPGAEVWPELTPEPTLAEVEAGVARGTMVCGTPEECWEQVAQLEAVGLDQVGFGMPLAMNHDLSVETLELFGRHVIPEFDTDPVHRTTRFREAAQVPPRAPTVAPTVARPELVDS